MQYRGVGPLLWTGNGHRVDNGGKCPSLPIVTSMDEQIRKIVPGKVSEDDKLIEYDALLLDHFFQILHDLYDEETQERVSKNHARKVSWLFRHFAMQ